VTGSPSVEPEGELLDIVESAQRVAGVLAARRRGDARDAAELLASFESPMALAEGALLLADLCLDLYRVRTGESTDDCVRDLCLQLEAALANGGSNR
jgi:hypothetical protein